MIIDCISDLYGHYPKLPGGDLLIVAGDLTATDHPDEYDKFCNWMQNMQYQKKVVIAGNHDTFVKKNNPWNGWSCYLQDSGTEFECLKIWGSPWTKYFEGQNPKACAFTCNTEDELAQKWALIPDNTDILITHSPPYKILDTLDSGKNSGSYTLANRVGQVKPKLHVFGHIHYQGCKQSAFMGILWINASHVDENYKPRKEGFVRIEL